MFSISPYAFYPFLQRFVTLWRYVQVVSDCLTFLLSMLCCQCWTMMPLSSEKGSVESFQIIPEAIIEAGRASGEPFQAQHLVIDFTPGPCDTPETGMKCQKFWDVVNSHPDLDGMMALPENKTVATKETTVPIHKPSSPMDNVSPLTALHIIRSMGDRGPIDAPLPATTSKYKH